MVTINDNFIEIATIKEMHSRDITIVIVLLWFSIVYYVRIYSSLFQNSISIHSS